MLKWTASSQKLNTDSPIAIPQRTVKGREIAERRRRSRRATIANKENIPYATSTPMVPKLRTTRNSPLVLAPLSDILNITPEIPSSPSMLNATLTPQRRKAPSTPIEPESKYPATRKNLKSRRHSTIGITLPSAVPSYARTLPRFQVEEYSPNTISPTGQQLALRGLVPDPFLSNARYFRTPEMKKVPTTLSSKSQLKKRKLETEFENENENENENKLNTKTKFVSADITGLSSSKMGNETLDKLIDAILDSARKDIKKKKSRKSFNLRRRTLLKSHTETAEDAVLSPSYAAGDDPASDLSFLLIEPPIIENVSTIAIKSLQIEATPIKTKLPAQQTPAPITPSPGTPISQSILCRLPTPTPALNVSTTTFKLETPVRTTHSRKRRQTHHYNTDVSSEHPNRTKKFKVDARNYFEIGVALPSIYV